MQKLSWAFAVAVLVALPLSAKAGFVIEASGGYGVQVSPGVETGLPPNVMLAAGYGLGEIIRAEIGFVVDKPEGEDPTNLRIRPMLVVDPPVLPVYGRLIVGFANLLDDERAFEYGAALGVGGSVGGLGLFAEAGYIPQSIEGEFHSFIEARAGAMLSF